MRITVLEAGKTHELDKLMRAFARRDRFEAQGARRNQYVVEHGAPRQQRGLLEHDADIAARSGDDLALHLDGAGRRRNEASRNLEQRRLSAARGPEDRDEAATLDGQIERLDRGQRDLSRHDR